MQAGIYFVCFRTVIAAFSSMVQIVSAVLWTAPAVKGPQPLCGSYLIHTSSSLISSLLFMGVSPNVAQGMGYLIRERLEHPPGSFLYVIMPVFCPTVPSKP